MAAVRDTIVDGKLHVAGDIVAAGIVAYPDSDKKISYPKTTCRDSYVPLCGVDDYSSDSKQRAYLDEIKVVKNSTDGISAISVQKSDSKLYDILGRSASKTGKGLRIINGKKVIF